MGPMGKDQGLGTMHGLSALRLNSAQPPKPLKLKPFNLP